MTHLFLLLLSLVGAAELPGLELTITCKSSTWFGGQQALVSATITNHADSTIVVLDLRDGSSAYQRPARAAWHVTSLLDRDLPDWPWPRSSSGLMCGNVSSPSEAEFLRIDPGETVHLGRAWLPGPSVPLRSGIYAITLYYENVPSRGWPAGSLHLSERELDSFEARALRSLECKLVSNKLLIERIGLITARD